MTEPPTDNTVTTDFEHSSCSNTITGAYEGPLCEACDAELEAKLHEVWRLLADLTTPTTAETDQ